MPFAFAVTIPVVAFGHNAPVSYLLHLAICFAILLNVSFSSVCAQIPTQAWPKAVPECISIFQS